jgi:hypothetical protein
MKALIFFHLFRILSTTSVACVGISSHRTKEGRTTIPPLIIIIVTHRRPKYLCQAYKNSIIKAKPQTKRKTEGGEEEEDEEEDVKSDMTARVRPFYHQRLYSSKN